MSRGYEWSRDKMASEFMELAAIDSPSFGERQMADVLTGKMREIGMEVTEDEAGDRIGGSAGNLLGSLSGSLPGPPILLSAHMDTVAPAVGKKAVRQGGRIVSGGDTVLGADDLAGVVEILEGIRFLLGNGLPHRDIEVLFTCAEEVCVVGAPWADYGRIRAGEAYTLDLSGPVGTASLREPTLIRFEVRVRGRSAHAGFEPEKGINAIAAAAAAIAGLSQGRLEEDTTLNIGTIRGGVQSNSVAQTCVCAGEIRSYRHERAGEVLREVERIFREKADLFGASAEIESHTPLHAYRVESGSGPVQKFRQACLRCGLRPELTETFGGSDNNQFVRRGIQGIVLSCGMQKVHTTEEYIETEDLERGARLVAELLQLEA